MTLNAFYSYVLTGCKRIFYGRNPYLGLLVFWLLACALAVVGLGDLPLRDFDEGTVARVALELLDKKGSEVLIPTLWYSDYLNKPPGLHWLIAIAMKLTGAGVVENKSLPSEFVIRIIPAFLSTFVVPLGGLIQWNLLRDRISSLATAGILLTLLPIARHGRLAMLDGTQLSGIALFWLLLISLDGSKKDRWRALGIGGVMSSMLLLKAPLIIPVACAGLIPMIWGRRFQDLSLWPINRWLTVGLLPGISWHIWHVISRGSDAAWLWWGDGAGRVLFTAGSGSDLGWRVPVIELLEGGWPWLLLWPIGVLWAWRERYSPWGRWTLATQFILSIAIFFLRTQLPWYSHSLWLPFALLVGRPFAWLILQSHEARPPARKILFLVPILWSVLASLIIFLGLIGFLGFFPAFRPYSLIALMAGLGWLLGGWLIGKSEEFQRSIGGLLVVIGSLAGLFVLMSGPLWLWELNEHWVVGPPANLAYRSQISDIALDDTFERPSLNWYAQKRILTIQAAPSIKSILTRDPGKFKLKFANKKCKTFDKEESWSLLVCNP